MATKSLPAEIVSQIAKYLSKRDLASGSLVSQSWRSAILPALYYSVILEENAHVEQFVSTLVSLGDGGDSTQISSFIKELKINLGDNDIDESVLLLLEPCVPKLSQLVKLHWNLFYVPKNLNLITLFQTQCPNLKSVDLLIPGGFKFKSKLGRSQYAILLGFKNLVDFRLKIDDIPAGIETEYVGPLKALLLDSPNIQSFTLSLDDDGNHFGEKYYSPDRFAASLGSKLILPCLRKLEFSGSVELDETMLFSPPEKGSHPFREFLSRHPQIEDLELGCSSVNTHSGKINPHYLSLALPSLKHFEGPDHVCDQLIRSTVASQLETLNIRPSSFEHGVDFIPDKVFPVQALPRLRKLDIETDESYDALEIMRLILPMTLELEELRITSMPHDYHRAFLGLLVHVPGLQKITMCNFSASIMKAMSSVFGLPHIPMPGEEDERLHEEVLKQKMKILCPKLKAIHQGL